MSWYAIGTVSVTNNNVAITGAGGTAWAANIQAGDAFKGPDEKLYEVQSVNSDTAITLTKVYAGTTAAGAAYAIIPTQGRVRDLAASVLQLITDVGDVDAALTVVSGRVGLGKSPNASAKLDVNGQVWVDAPTGDATLRMLVSGVEKGKLAVTSAGRVYIESNGAEVMTLLNGNVGIGTGTSAPLRKLHVTTASTTVGDYGVVVEGSQSGYGAGISFQSRLGTSNALAEMGRLVWDGEASWSSTSTATQNSYARLMVAKNGVTVEALRLDSVGNVLINNAPTSLGTGYTNLHARGSTGAIVEASNATHSVAISVDSSGARIGSRTATPLYLTVNNTPVISASTAGNVTIAAPSSGVALTVSGRTQVNASSSDVLAIQNIAGVGAKLTMYDTGYAAAIGTLGGDLLFYTAGNTVERSRITTAGNIITAPPATPPTLANNGEMVMNLTSNTNLRISARGGDGVTRVANITLA